MLMFDIVFELPCCIRNVNFKIDIKNRRYYVRQFCLVFKNWQMQYEKEKQRKKERKKKKKKGGGGWGITTKKISEINNDGKIYLTL